MVFFGGFFDERGGGHYIFCVFFLYLFAERISEAPMSRVGDIIFSAWFFLYIIHRKDQRSCDGHEGDLGT